jgi:hypothetical protein
MDSVIVDAAAPYVPVLRPMRALLVVFGVLTLLAVAALFVRPETTDRFFAWTIQPPLTAAFLGAAYLAGCTLVVLSLRATAWVHARAAIVTILVFTVLTLLATLVHLDLFHLDDGQVVARGAAWFWLVVYCLVPVALLVLLVLQARTAGTDPARSRPLPRLLVVALLAEGGVMLVVGAVLFVAPGALAGWPWPLAPLSSRAVGAWLIAFGLAAALAVAEGDVARLRAPAAAYLVFGLAEIAVLARFAGDLTWDAATWAYLAFLVLVVVTAAAGVRLGARPRSGASSGAGSVRGWTA